MESPNRWHDYARKRPTALRKSAFGWEQGKLTSRSGPAERPGLLLGFLGTAGAGGASAAWNHWCSSRMRPSRRRWRGRVRRRCGSWMRGGCLECSWIFGALWRCLPEEACSGFGKFFKQLTRASWGTRLSVAGLAARQKKAVVGRRLVIAPALSTLGPCRPADRSVRR